jgi:hypothetical protein
MKRQSVAMPRSARHLALATCIVAVLSLGLQFQVSHTLLGQGRATATLWYLAGYLTILTYLAVALVMLGAATRPTPGPRLSGGLILAIGMVGLVYHRILARLWAPKGR